MIGCADLKCATASSLSTNGDWHTPQRYLKISMSHRIKFFRIKIKFFRIFSKLEASLYPLAVLMRVRLRGGGVLCSLISIFGSIRGTLYSSVSGRNFGIDSSFASTLISRVCAYNIILLHNIRCCWMCDWSRALSSITYRTATHVLGMHFHMSVSWLRARKSRITFRTLVCLVANMRRRLLPRLRGDFLSKQCSAPALMGE